MMKTAESSKTDSVLRQLAALRHMTLDQLRDEWRALNGAEPPPYTNDFLRKRLAYRLQELAHGGLPADERTRLGALLKDRGFDCMGIQTRPIKRAKDLPPPGTRLIREWNGGRHEVTVTQTGFEFEGRRYRSLSAIAKAITGTHWNGCAFFGLRTRKQQE
jgi:hypothetical protein